MGARLARSTASRPRRTSSAIPVVSGNVSLYNETGGRPIPPTPVVGCVGLVADVAPDSRRAGAPATARFLLRGEGAELVRFVWQHAHRFTLAHDIGDGGAALALRQAAAWSGVETALTCPEGPGVIVTLAPGDDEPLAWPDIVELGTV